MKLPVRWGVIGCGSVTEVKSTPAFQQVNGFEVTAVLARDQVKVDNYIKRHNIEFGYCDFNAFIARVDAVYIATPPDTHLTYAAMVLEHRKPCCIEKPISNNTQQAAEIVNAYNDAKVPLFVSYYRRSLPRFLKIKEWLIENKIGQVRHVNWCFAKPANDLDIGKRINWRTDSSVAPGGYFEDLSSHGLDLFCYLLGDTVFAKGIATNQQHLYAAKDSVAGVWLHKDGITGSGFWNFGAGERLDRVEILGSEGKIIFSVFLEAPVILESKNHTDRQQIANPKNIQIPHAENILLHLQGKRKHPSTGESALHTNRIMDQILN